MTGALHRRILLYYDASATAKKALDVALSLAKENGAELFVICVALAWLNREDIEDKALAELSFYAAKRRLAAIEPLVRGMGIQAHFDVVQGNRPEEIARAAANRDADLIVLGERERRTSRRPLSEQVKDHARRPVVVVH